CGPRGLGSPARKGRAGAQLLVLAPVGRLPAGDRGHGGGDRPVPRGPGGDPVNRTATIDRNTSETTIHLELDLDGSGTVAADTGLPFFDHMLSQLGRHGGLDLTVAAKGDLEIDAHHTVEDVGLALGQALKEALGDKAGVRRFASVAVPLDEALGGWCLDPSPPP